MMNPILWQPSEAAMKESQIFQFMQKAGKKNYDELYQWSINHLDEFWSAMAEFAGLTSLHGVERRTNLERFEPWLPEGTINYAEHLLRNPDNTFAVIAYDENGEQASLTRHELYLAVARAQAWLIEAGITQHEVVAGVLPNVPEAIIFMLATTALGAIWTSCSPDFGVPALIDRLSQVSPRVLITAPGYTYKGKWIDCALKNAQLAEALPASVRTLSISAPIPTEARTVRFEPLSFNHPAFILYSSGTTGMPKCIVHGHGGTLIQHMKELMLHTDLKTGDRLLYLTTCGWMMWNWMVSALGTGATLVLYEGSSLYPEPDSLFEVLSEAKVTVFGTSAKFLSTWQHAGVVGLGSSAFAQVRTILSTGSPLMADTFDYVYQSLKHEVCLSSIAGGTDLISCFGLGNPLLPVYQGELQCRGLGMAVEIWDETGHPLIDQQGELVCVKPFPSMPIKFWNDPDNLKYHQAYFARFKNVWTHGDYAMLKANGCLVIFGRSDALLNPGGVRIGTAEIYRQVETLPSVTEALAIGFNHDDTQDIILFVILAPGQSLTDALRLEIKQRLRQNASPRHVPAQIYQVQDFPRTLNGKISELAVSKIFNRQPLDNLQALANPEVLDIFRRLRETHILDPL